MSRPNYIFNLLSSAENFMVLNNLQHWVLVKHGEGYCVYNPNHLRYRGR